MSANRSRDVDRLLLACGVAQSARVEGSDASLLAILANLRAVIAEHAGRFSPPLCRMMSPRDEIDCREAFGRFEPDVV